MLTVRQLLRSKGEMVWTISPDTEVHDALQLMMMKNIGALMVVDGNEVLGIFSERDYARNVLLLNKLSMDTPVAQIMNKTVFCVTPDQTVSQCMALMTDKRVRHLPVLDDNRLIGIVSIGDLVNNMMSEQESTIRFLENYIVGGDYSYRHEIMINP